MDHADSASPAAARRKFGDALDAGFQIVPDVLIRNQTKLDLLPLDMVILLNILVHWWGADELPFPRLQTIASRIGISSRSVERRIVFLEKKGLLRRLPAEKNADGLTVRRFDLSGLIQQLQILARSDRAYDARRQKQRSLVAA